MNMKPTSSYRNRCHYGHKAKGPKCPSFVPQQTRANERAPAVSASHFTHTHTHTQTRDDLMIKTHTHKGGTQATTHTKNAWHVSQTGIPNCWQCDPCAGPIVLRAYVQQYELIHACVHTSFTWSHTRTRSLTHGAYCVWMLVRGCNMPFDHAWLCNSVWILRLFYSIYKTFIYYTKQTCFVDLKTA